MKKLYLILLLALCIIPSWKYASADNSVNLVITLKDNKQKVIAINKDSKIDFTGNFMLITASDDTDFVKTNDIISMKYSYDTDLGIDIKPEDSASEVDFVYFKDALQIHGANPHEPITIFRIDGIAAMKTECDANGKVTVNCRSLVPGIYIVRSTTNSYKFTVR